jgi:hypothetical protein
MKKYIPAFILAIGAVLRVAGTGSAAIWFDESVTLYRTTIPIMTLFTEHSERSGDFLLELILRPLMLISHSLWMLRLPSMLAALVSIWLVWKLMQRLEFSLLQQIVSTCLITFLPGMLWMAQDARSYGLLTMLILAGIWFALEGRYLGLLATCGLMVYAHNTGPVWAAGVLAIAWWLRPAQLRFVVCAGVGIALAWIPAIYRMLDYWIIQAPWQPHLTFPWLVFSVVQSFFPVLWPALFPLAGFALIWITYLILLIVLLAVTFSIRLPGRMVPLMAWLLPFLALVIFCLAGSQNIINYRTLMPGLFPFALWLGWELGRKGWLYYIQLAPWAAMLIWGMVLWSPAYRGGGLDYVADQIRSQWQDGDTLVYTTVTVGLPFDYYLSDLPHRWNDIIQDPYFLGIPTIQRTSLPVPVKHSGRMWVVIPDEPMLITPPEWLQLADLVNHQEPIFTLYYVQAATTKVFLVKDKEISK